MSKNLTGVLDQLRDLASTKISELETLCEEQKNWLQTAVTNVREQIAGLAPASKRQKLDTCGSNSTLEQEVRRPLSTVYIKLLT
jgi:hypothetical protein